MCTCLLGGYNKYIWDTLRRFYILVREYPIYMFSGMCGYNPFSFVYLEDTTNALLICVDTLVAEIVNHNGTDGQRTGDEGTDGRTDTTTATPGQTRREKRAEDGRRRRDGRT